MQSQKLVDTESVVVSKQAELHKACEDIALLQATAADQVGSTTFDSMSSCHVINASTATTMSMSVLWKLHVHLCGLDVAHVQTQKLTDAESMIESKQQDVDKYCEEIARLQASMAESVSPGGFVVFPT